MGESSEQEEEKREEEKETEQEGNTEEKKQDERPCLVPVGMSSLRVSNLDMMQGGGEVPRRDHLQALIRQRRASVRLMQEDLLLTRKTSVEAAEAIIAIQEEEAFELTESHKERIVQDIKFLRHVEKIREETKSVMPEALSYAKVEVRVENFSFKVTVDPESQKIQTVYNQSVVYKVWKWIKRRMGKEPPRPLPVEMTVLDRINLTFLPGKMYLLLGPPSCGKTTLLKAIAGRLHTSKRAKIEGNVLYNGESLRVSRVAEQFLLVVFSSS
jgi:ABC-type multidrug transport system fused ATPase/permease subunit